MAIDTGYALYLHLRRENGTSKTHPYPSRDWKLEDSSEELSEMIVASFLKHEMSLSSSQFPSSEGVGGA